MTYLEEWADYETANDKANLAYQRRGCPVCGDIADDHKHGVRCRLHKEDS